MKCFPPFFPDIPVLRKYLWHKVFWVICTAISALSVYSSLVLLFIIFNAYGLINARYSEELLTLPMVPLLVPFMLSNESNTPVIYLNNNFSQVLNLSVLSDNNFGLWILLLYFLFLVVLPGALYKFLLGAVWGDSFWRNKLIKRSKN